MRSVQSTMEMRQRFARLYALLLLAAGIFAGEAVAVGSMPVPALRDMAVVGGVTRDAGQGFMNYRYTLTSGAQSRGEVFMAVIDVSARADVYYSDSDAFRIPNATGSISFADARLFFDVLKNYKQARGVFDDEYNGTWHIPVGLAVPAGWVGGLTIDGGAQFLLRDRQRGIAPGTSLGGFSLQSYAHPTLRDMRISPFWMHVVADHDLVGSDERQQASDIEAALDVVVPTLGPGGAHPGTVGHWNAIRDDLQRMRSLGWIADPAWGDAVALALAEARQAYDAQDYYLTKQRIERAQVIVAESKPAQRRGEVADHLRENLWLLYNSTADNVREPKLSLLPEKSSAALGDTLRLTLTLTDLANGNRPIVGESVRFEIDGANAGYARTLETDSAGMAVFDYRGLRQGVDRIVALVGRGEVRFQTEARALWSGGADLVVPLFVPPLLDSAGGRQFRIAERTENIGNATAGESVTRYYISTEPIRDVARARVLGERQVPSLPEGGESRVPETVYQVPADLPAGRYYLAACADAGARVVEKNEDNNCSFHEIPGFTPTIVPGSPRSQPPRCDAAQAVPASLWPPNHKWGNVRIDGIVHPENLSTTVRIAKITQDEPTDGLGDGDTRPDGAGIGTSQARLRAERSGTGNGRVYRIAFTATDTRGLSCAGSVAVGVPHDQRPGGEAIDDGQRFDSTQ